MPEQLDLDPGDPAEPYVLTYGPYIVGKVSSPAERGERGVLELDAGWCRLAGLGIVVRADPDRDHRRFLLRRGVEDETGGSAPEGS